MRKNAFCHNLLVLLTGIFIFFTSQRAAFALKADFIVSTSSSASGCSPLPVNFTNTSTGAVSYFWRLGNGNNSTLKDAGAIYSAAGKYTVTLIVKDASGNVDSVVKTDLITVFANPVADYKTDVKKGCAPLTVNFSDLSKKGSEDIVSWLWDFGDGNTSTKQNPKNTYTFTGNFDVTLIVTDKNGCKHTFTRSKYIIVPPKPTASFSASDSLKCTSPLSVTFTPKATSAIGGKLRYLWDFGDGATDTKEKPTHKYTSEGNFTIKLTVTDTGDCSTTIIKSQYINIGKEKADFSFFPVTACPPMQVSFKNLTMPGKAASYSWDFGDGNFSSANDPDNTFTNSGTFRVKLKVTSAAGCVDTISKTITLLEQPKASFTASDSFSCRKNLVVRFTNTTPGGKVISWDFGDGHDTGSVNTIDHLYQDTGTYTVKLYVMGANGCTKTLIKKNYIKISLPVDTFGVEPKEGCLPLKVTFKNFTRSLVPITDWVWDFGDGNISTLKDPGSYTYEKEGIYNSKLIIGNSRGCYDTFSVRIKVGSKPTSNFTASPLKGCISDMNVVFKNLSLKADSFFWEFGDASTSDKVNPEHQYDVKAGKYTVKLTVWNKGCKDTFSRPNYIEILPPWANFTLTQELCMPDSITLKDASVGGDSIIYDFGDGTTSNDRNPTHVFKSPGIYNVVQRAYNRTTKCIDTFLQEVKVDPMIASIIPKDTIGCVPLNVSFITVVNKLADVEWDFGDGSKSNDTDPTHTYTTSGTYTVTAKITSKVDNCVKIIKKENLVSAYGPTAKFFVENESGCIPLKVRIIDSSRSTRKVAKKILDMGNGTQLKITDPVTEYTYNNPPEIQTEGFTITLSVIDDAGCSQSVSRKVYPSFPRPDFYTLTEPSCGEIKYRFVPMVDGANGIGPFQYSWSFGGNDTSSDEVMERTFTESGKHKVRLMLTDKNGCKDSIVKEIKIDIRFPVAKMSADPSKADCPPLYTKFKDETILGFKGIETWRWDFGDGTYSDKEKPEKIYLKPGKFTVKLVVTDSVGCSDSIIGPDMIVVGGPVGTLHINKKAGCTPLTVNLKVDSKNTYRYTWDLGDGTVLLNSDKSEIEHTYGYASAFIPSVTLMDSNGCQYYLPPVDTIIVDPLPITDFSYSGLCFGYPTFFTDLSTPAKGDIKAWLWEFGDGTTSAGSNPTHVYDAPGNYEVSLTVVNGGGCKTKNTKKIRIYGLDAQLTVSQPSGCIGFPLYFTDKTFADTTIISRLWSFGDSTTSTAINPQHIYIKKGIYRVQLIAFDITGCSDTFTIDKMIIGDTVPPPSPKIYRVSVENDNTVELSFEKYRDVDFYKYIIYRKDPGGAFHIIDSVMNADDTVYMDATVNTLHNVYCYKVLVQNICGFASKLINNEHCTVELTATPAVNAAVLNWNFYYGWKKVNRYEIYREDVYNKGSFYQVGTVAGDIKTFSDTSIICYRTHVYKIKAYEDSGFMQLSWSDTSTTTPIYIPHVPPAYVVRATVENNKEVLVEWNDLPNVKVKNFVVQKSEDGINYNPVDVPLPRTTLSLTDKKVKVNQKSYFYRVQVIDSCGDASPYSNLGKTILLKVDTTVNLRPQLQWTKYRDWPTGVRYYDVELKQADGSFIKIGRTQSGDDTVFVDDITDLNSLPDYCYRVIAHRKGGAADLDEFLHITSMSNQACTPIRSTLWIPNVFTPNNDSANDQFFAVGLYIKTFEMKIFDRWGARVYENKSIHEGWNGKFRGDAPLMDAYKYIIKAQGVDGRHFYRQGWVTVLP